MSITSSMPYNTYQGTPFMEINSFSNEGEIVYSYKENYPDSDEEGFDNGGDISLRNIILFGIEYDNLVIKSVKNNISIDKKSIKKVNDELYIVDLREYFSREEIPFHEDRIDFELCFSGSSKKMSFTPILIGVYWDNLEDYYKENSCNSVDKTR